VPCWLTGSKKERSSGRLGFCRRRKR